METREYSPEEFRSHLRVFNGGAEAEPSNNVNPETGRTQGAESPVELDDEAMKVYRGESPLLKEDGSVDRSRSLYKIGALLTERLTETKLAEQSVRELIVRTLEERDRFLGWDKYSERGDSGEYERIAAKLLSERGELSREAAEAKVSPAPSDPYFGEPIPLGKAIREGIEPPKQLLESVLLEGRVHHLFGAPGKGKSWIALHFAAQLVERGRKVLYLDKENGTNLMAERLKDLGVDHGRLDTYLLYWDQISMPVEDRAREAFGRLLDDKQPELVIFDSLVAFLASAGLEENDSGDVARWAEHFAMGARARDIAVLLIDHVPHEQERPRGSSRKTELVDVQWALKRRRAFSRSTSGEISLLLKKDREGGLPERADYTLSSLSEGRVSIQKEEILDPAARLSEQRRKVLELLDDFPGGATSSEWKEAWEQKYEGSTGVHPLDRTTS